MFIQISFKPFRLHISLTQRPPIVAKVVGLLPRIRETIEARSFFSPVSVGG